jgi:hypothetical protein
MTDARLPERWLNDRRLLRLSDENFRSFVMALVWSVSNRTDGCIEPEDLALIPTFVVGASDALVKAGLWTRLDYGWRINDFGITQTSRNDLEVLENNRRRDREKKSRQRAAKAAENDSCHDDVPRDIPGGHSRGTSQDRTGHARTGTGQGLDGYDTKRQSEASAYRLGSDINGRIP